MSRYYPQSQQSVQLAVTPPLVSSALTVAKLLLLFYFLFLLFMFLPLGGAKSRMEEKNGKNIISKNSEEEENR